MKQLLILCVFIALALSCAKKSDDSSSSSLTVSNPLTDAVSTINTSAGKMTSLNPSSSFVGLTEEDNIYRAKATQGFTEWSTTVTNLIDERTNTGTSPKEWMGVQLNKNAVRSNDSKISMFGRLEDALSIFCAVGVGVGNSSAYPDNNTYSIVLSGTTKTTIESQCNITVDAQMDGQTVTLLVEDAATTTVYDKKITITLPGPSTQIYYVRSNATSINVATDEVNGNGLHRTVVAYDVATKVMKLEYVSAPDAALANGDHVAAYRLYYDETNDVGYMMAMEYSKDVTNVETKYIMAGKPQTSGSTFALSFMTSTFTSNAANARQACINSTTGAIASDNTLACSLTGTDVDATVTAVENLISGWTNTNYNSVSVNTTLSFTSGNFATANFSTN